MAPLNPASSEIMNVREIIDFAFGDLEDNTVNFKLIQTVLYLLARQLRLLERRVEVAVPYGLVESRNSLKVTEVKIHAAKKKLQKTQDAKADKGEKLEKGDKGEKVAGKGKSGKDQAKKSGKSPKSHSPGRKGHGKGKPADILNVLEESVSMQEMELRVFHQRADSHEQPDEAPSPLDSADMEYEKLLVVERVPSGTHPDGTRKLAVVTQGEFTKLAEAVDELQNRFAPIGTAEFPENAQLMEELRKCASLTDAMAALQLSARLEATEKALSRMIGIVTAVVSTTPGIDLDDETKAILARGLTAGRPFESQAAMVDKSTEIPTSADGLTGDQESKRDSGGPEGQSARSDCVTYADLDRQLQEICDEMVTEITSITTRNTANADKALKLATTLEHRLDATLNVGPRMAALESLVSTYVEQINALDTGLSSQMTNYQEQLVQMQHELEIGLETMTESLANTGGDTVAVAELNNSFLNLQMDFETMTYRQRDLQEIQEGLERDLADLWKQLEMLRDTKSDRDEVADALRDKAGIDALNGLVTLEQFDAVRGDLEKRIGAAYDKFNNQEIVWQKAIDDLLRELSEKGDLVQLYSLRDEINKYFNIMKARMKAITDIVGDPKAAATNKRLFRDTACISCYTPATMDVEAETIPVLPKFPEKKDSVEIDEDKLKRKGDGDGDHKLCYPGLPIPHAKDPRAHVCHRFCGGSHTLIPSGLTKTPPSTVITQMPAKKVTIEEGTDGKMYKVDDQPKKVPCIPCNKPQKKHKETSPPPKSPVKDKKGESMDFGSMTVPDDIDLTISPRK